MADKPEKPEKSAVRVMVRIRPFSKRELGDNVYDFPMSVAMMDGHKVNVMDQNGALADSFDFHETFWSIPEDQKQFCKAPFCDQENVFQRTGIAAVGDAFKGYHTCIFAYGQTGSGKTHTMLGSAEDPGITPRLISHLYDELEAMEKNKPSWEYNIEISFMEIYNEKVKDLLSTVNEQPKPQRKNSKAFPSPGGVSALLGESNEPRSKLGRRKSSLHTKKSGIGLKRPSFNVGKGTAPVEDEYADLRVRSSPSVGIFVEGLTRIGRKQGINCASDVMKLMEFGMNHRTTAATAMNDTSSRSHAVFQICLTMKNSVQGTQRYAHINLVDLAGSEKVKMSKAEGQTLTEATKINLSLSTLRRVIDVLIDNSNRKKGQPKQLPPYRESLLTWILSESLGGNSKTMMIATISPAESNREDTLNTLRYALKTKAIINTVKVNEQKSSVMLSGMQKEMARLREQLNDPVAARSEEEIEEMKAQQEMLMREMEQNAAAAEIEAKRVSEHLEAIKRKEAEAQAKAKELEELKDENIGEKNLVAKEEAAEKEIYVTKAREELTKVRDVGKEKEELRNELILQSQGAAQDVQQVLTTTMLMSHEGVHQRVGHYREAFRKAFFKDRTAAKKERMLEDYKSITSITSKLAMQIETVTRDIRDSELVNMKQATHTTRAENELQRLVKKVEKDINDKTLELKAITPVVEAEEEEVFEEERILKSLTEEYNTWKNKPPTKIVETVNDLNKKISEEQSKNKEATVKLSTIMQNKELLEKLVVDLQKENTAADRQLTEDRKRIAALREEIAVTKQDIANLNTTIITTENETKELADDINVILAKEATLREDAEGMERKHNDLRKFAMERFFPSGGAPQVVLNEWVDIAVNTEFEAGTHPDASPERPILRRPIDTHREWCHGGYRHVSKRHTSPLRRSNTITSVADSSASPPGNGFRRNETHSHSSPTRRVSPRTFRRYETQQSHPSPSRHQRVM
eukprot:TRINITY_DN5672_c0_g1_i1.p1 TRINITY_DN5672_c0_g1~~TRINITY_DN5672_c0_g1_i1.p1  ORF type:complete len:977 (+),score=259.77 TRINITY_DN5672_c0_g1_i1:46-2976(+)